MLSCILALCTQVAAPLEAPGEPPEQDLDAAEILVTGERMERSIRATASSVAVFTAATIEASGADRLDQLIALVPNVQHGSGEEGPAIRGQDSTGPLRNLFAFLGGTRPRVTLQTDGRAAGYYEFVSSSAPLWDVERIEFFRSPQSTTQGRNSIAGAIFIETNDPRYDWGANVRVSAGSSATRHYSVAVTGPILANQVAIRASGDLRFSRTASDLADGIPDADIRRDDYGVARLKLLVEPAALPGLRVETTYAHTRTQAPQFEAVRRPFAERRSTVFERTNGVHRINIDALTIRTEYEASDDLNGQLTLSYGDTLLRRIALPGLGRTRVDATDGSIEGLLQWRPAPALALVAGAHLLETRQDQFIDITGLGIGAGSFDDRQDSMGLFSQAVWQPAPGWEFTGGLRYQRDRQVRTGQVGPRPGGIALDYDETFDAWLPKVVLSRKLSSGVVAGFMVQRAFNPGGTSVNLRTRAQDTFEAETLWNYEAFLRLGGTGGAVLSANLFYNDISDAQRQQLVSFPLPGGGSFDSVEFANAPKVETYGAEAELSWQVADTLSVRGGLGLMRSKLKKAVLDRDPTEGKELQRAPHLTAAAAIDWTPTAAARLSSQVRHHSGYFSDDSNDPRLRIKSATIVDARAAYSLGRTTVFAHVLNVFDAFYLTYLFNTDLGAAGDPREIGVGIEHRF